LIGFDKGQNLEGWKAWGSPMIIRSRARTGEMMCLLTKGESIPLKNVVNLTARKK
jgi:hypothetical protein